MVPVLCLMLSACLCAQSAREDTREKDMIQHTKSLPVSSFDRALPKVSLEYFLQYESGGAAIHWEVHDCGEQPGKLESHASRELRTCVEADFDSNHLSVRVLIAPGTFNQGISTRPVLFNATLTDLSGDTRSIRRLSDLPRELHRPLPRLPRELSEPRG